MFKNFFITR